MMLVVLPTKSGTAKTVIKKMRSTSIDIVLQRERADLVQRLRDIAEAHGISVFTSVLDACRSVSQSKGVCINKPGKNTFRSMREEFRQNGTLAGLIAQWEAGQIDGCDAQAQAAAAHESLIGMHIPVLKLRQPKRWRHPRQWGHRRSAEEARTRSSPA